MVKEDGVAETASEDILLSVDDDGIATVTLNRPASLNSLTAAMTSEYLRLIHALNADGRVKVIVVTGAGRGFCAGADRAALQDLDIPTLRAASSAEPRDAVVRIAKPVIAAVNGAVAGVGLAHALLADIRFTVRDAKWTTSFAKLGLVAEVNTSWLLVQLAGTGRALDLLLSARVFSGQEAYDYGLAQFISAPETLLHDVYAYARLIAANNPASLTAMREQVRADAGRSYADAWNDSYDRVFDSLERGDFRSRATRAGTEQR